jgi:hypothetical protein
MSFVALLLAAAAGSVDVAGRIGFPPNASAPSVELTLRAPQRDDVVVTCPVAADTTFRCRVPAGVFDVRLSMAGFVPVYRWAMELKAPAAEIGTIAAQRSSSVAGWVVDARHRRPVDGATIALLEPGDEAVVRQTTKGNARGFFQFAGVEPGTYGIRATAKGFSPAHALNVVVRESEETLVRDVALSGLGRLTVNITPPMRSQSEEWHVALMRGAPMTPYTRVAGRAFADAAGTAEFANLESGAYFVRVFDVSGTTYAQETQQIDGDTPPLNIRLPLVPIRGRVKSGTTGLKAAVEFQSFKKPTVRLHSNENGDFEGLLPDEGHWNVSVVLPSRQDLNLRKGVDVKRRDAEEFARVDVELPAGRLEGRVIDEDGHGVSTGIRLTRDGRGFPDSAALSDADGHFRFVALETGSVTLDAGDGELLSGPVPASISEETEPVTVTVHKSRKLKAWITTPAGYPVIGASVRYWPEGNALGGQKMTNPSGTFELAVAATARFVDFFVAGAGVPVMLRRVAITESNEPIHLVTAAVPGRLLVPIRETAPPYPLVSHDGVTTTLDGILWPGHVLGVRPQGETPDGFLFDVDPGRYSVCLRNNCKIVDVAPSAQMKADPYQ